MEYRIGVPAGIGDVSWIWSKLCTLKDDKFTIYTPETTPMRTFQWLHLLGEKVIPMVGKFDYNTILKSEAIHGYGTYKESWEDITKMHDEGEVIYLQPNQNFLKGIPLAEWIPDLGIDFHYPLHISKEDEVSGGDLLRLAGGGSYNLGIHMASMKGVRAWKAWLPEDWAIFIRGVKKAFPELKIVLLGGGWDLDMGLELKSLLPKENLVDLIGRTNIGQVITILRSLSYYVGYSSGLNVMCNVMNKPCTALWPDWQEHHIYPHADPKDVVSRRYMGFVYDSPKRILTRIKGAIQRGMEESHGW
jgi:hypothetical protein